MNNISEKIGAILQKYKGESSLFHKTIEELSAKGFSNGCYQNYELVIDLLTILFICENEVKRISKEEQGKMTNRDYLNSLNNEDFVYSICTRYAYYNSKYFDFDLDAIDLVDLIKYYFISWLEEEFNEVDFYNIDCLNESED